MPQMPREVDKTSLAISASRKRRRLPVLGSSSTTSSASVAALAACIIFSFGALLYTSSLNDIGGEERMQTMITLNSLDVSANSDTKSRRLLDEQRKSNSSDFSLLEWNGIQIDTTKRAACGYRKCFFHSGVNESEGYLLARAESDWMGRMKRTWKDARRLKKKYNMRHFMLEPPHHSGVPPRKVLKELNSLVASTQSPQKTRSFFGSTKKKQYNLASNSTSKDRGIVVQKVKLAPTPSLIVRCYFFKGHRNGRYFLDKESSSEDVFRSAVHDKASFVSTFQAETKDLISLLAKEARLWYDFQFMVDSRGRIHHIDLDRMETSGGFHFPSGKGAQNCLTDAVKGVSNIIVGTHDSNATDVVSAS
mmetsp:Transcript_9843/g.22035  ORF Transcript_9843/g.22035 Transcript_9843/m.22035 type:complete len:363 (-) Transcript_9843:1926-3014(-)